MSKPITFDEASGGGGMIADIGMAATEAQSLLSLVADKLRTSEGLAADEVFNLYVAVQVAIDRLDVVHEVLPAADAPLVAQSPGAIL